MATTDDNAPKAGPEARLAAHFEVARIGGEALNSLEFECSCGTAYMVANNASSAYPPIDWLVDHIKHQMDAAYRRGFTSLAKPGPIQLMPEPPSLESIIPLMDDRTLVSVVAALLLPIIVNRVGAAAGANKDAISAAMNLIDQADEALDERREEKKKLEG